MILTQLRPHQGEAVGAALPHDGFALFPEQRTGKCLISLALVDARKPDVVVIVCPKKALRVWRQQIKEHLKFDWPCEKAIVHYEAMCRSAKDRRWWRYRFRHTWAGKKVFLIVDEGHRIKARGSLQGRMMRSLGKLSDYRLLLTGTPVDKLAQDAWSLFEFLKPGVFGDDWEEYRDEYLKMGGFKNKKVMGFRNKKARKRFMRIVQKYSFRVTLRAAQKAAGVRPYRVRRRVVRFDLKPESRRIYNELLTELVAEVRKRRVSTPLVVTLVSKLQQLAGGYLIHTEPIYDEDDLPVLLPSGRPKISRSIIPVGREKVVSLLKLIKRYPLRKKIVICFQYRHEIERVGKQLEKLGRSWKRVAGGEGFDGRFDTDTILMQIRSGEAIDLSAAKLFIMYSWDHSNISHEQAKFRVLTFKTDLIDYVYLMANDTVDFQIYQAVRKKKKITDLVIDKYRYRRTA